MKPGYIIENRIPIEEVHWGILVYNWEVLNIVQNHAIIENSISLKHRHDYHVGLWKLKNK